MVKIDKYSFGKILINNKLYTKDLIILEDIIKDNWQRKSGHSLILNDIQLIIDYQPDMIFIGTGKLGALKVSNDIISQINNYGINDVIVGKSDTIVEKFNKCKIAKKALAIHLTC